MTARAGSGAEGYVTRLDDLPSGVPTSAAVAAVDSRGVGVIDNIVDEHAGLAYAEPGELLGDSGAAIPAARGRSIPPTLRARTQMNISSERENMAVKKIATT